VGATFAPNGGLSIKARGGAIYIVMAPAYSHSKPLEPEEKKEESKGGAVCLCGRTGRKQKKTRGNAENIFSPFSSKKPVGSLRPEAQAVFWGARDPRKCEKKKNRQPPNIRCPEWCGGDKAETRNNSGISGNSQICCRQSVGKENPEIKVREGLTR